MLHDIGDVVMPISKLDSVVAMGTETIKKTLKRSVGLAGVVIISLSAMLPGIFVTPTFAADIMGAGIWLAFIIAAAVVLPAAISKAELASGCLLYTSPSPRDED